MSIVGWIGTKICKAKYDDEVGIYVATRLNKQWKGVTLGDVIMFSEDGWKSWPNAFEHELGHFRQYKKLWILYWPIIAIPSLLGNIKCKITKDWSKYYEQPWEKWADKLGGVLR